MLVRLSSTAATGISTTVYGSIKEAQAEDADPVVTLYRMVGLVRKRAYYNLYNFVLYLE
jgi:hypothetical protein